MAELPILASFHVRLSDEVVADLFTNGKNFIRELVDGGGGREGLGPSVPSVPLVGGDGDGAISLSSSVGVDLTVGHRARAGGEGSEGVIKESLQFFSVQLEKQSDAVIKLIITVYKADSTDQDQQTDPPASVSDKSVQDDRFAASDGTTQTDTCQIKDAAVQTKEKRLWQACTASMTDFNMSTQKDGAVDAVVESKSSFTQTELSAATVSVQTERSEAVASIQTDPPSIEDAIAQTDPPLISQIEVQTESSMAREQDMQTQASVEVNEAFMQTELIQRESESQTEISVALRSDGEVQASAETSAQPTQTEVEIGEDASQTELSMFLQKESESQCSCETSELSCQTESQLEHNSCQTTTSLLLQTEQETQAGTEMSDSFIQTDNEEPVATKTQVTTLSQESSVSAGDCQDPGNDSLNVSQDLFTEIVNHEDAGTRKRRNSETMKDGVAQTDPVTIIIGDASFLVKKLKSSAVSPSKITTSGNEIEIELSAEVAGSEAPFGADEKENDIQRYPAVMPEAVLSRQGPMIRGAIPGVVTRGVGGGGGVRVRMPAGMQSPMVARLPGSRVQSSPQVRFQSPGVVRAAGMAPAPRHVGRHSTGGTFSCPFCSLIFIDSPALYEHLSMNHQVDQKTKWKQPKGREGKTIIPRKQQRSPDNSPPVLTAMEPHAAQYAVPVTENTEDEGEEAHEAGLFEDPVEMSAVKRRRGRPKTRGSDHDAGASDDDNQTSGKRHRKEYDGATSKRARVEEQWDETEEDEVDEPVVVKTSRRGGRTPRSRTK